MELCCCPRCGGPRTTTVRLQRPNALPLPNAKVLSRLTGGPRRVCGFSPTSDARCGKRLVLRCPWVDEHVPGMSSRFRPPLFGRCARIAALAGGIALLGANVPLADVGTDPPGMSAHPGGEKGPGRMSAGPLGISSAREGSGTSWLPDSSPMYMLNVQAGDWSLGLMANVFAELISEQGARGDTHFGSVNWMMAMATHSVLGGVLRGRAMLSLEPLTLGTCGYPDLLATGEQCNGAAIHDRQHPHDLFMELSMAYSRALSDDLAFEVYGGPAGEPALGPTAFPHRPSAMPSPMAPITHHWLDSTHISYGVVTAGVFGRRWKIEGSIFNGREPDDRRYDFDFGAMDSYSGRFWFLPDDHWALQVSAGHLTQAEQRVGEPRVDVDRVTASATFNVPLQSGGNWATTAAFGLNSEQDHSSNGILLESSLDLEERDILFSRLELVQKSGQDLSVPGVDLHAESWVSKLALTYVRQIRIAIGSAGLLFGAGVGASLNWVPTEFAAAYGGRWPWGFLGFLSLRPAPMQMRDMPHGDARPPAMPGMRGM